MGRTPLPTPIKLRIIFSKNYGLETLVRVTTNLLEVGHYSSGSQGMWHGFSQMFFRTRVVMSPRQNHGPGSTLNDLQRTP